LRAARRRTEHELRIETVLTQEISDQASSLLSVARKGPLKIIHIRRACGLGVAQKQQAHRGGPV
jgi:hypothetical protein